MNILRIPIALACSLPLLLFNTGGASHRIEIAEQFGYAKRAQLVDRVEDARDDQAEAKEQFASALEAFSALTNFDGGDLERQYRTIDRELRRSEARASDVHERIASVRRVGDALVSEWRTELNQYDSASLRAASEDQLRQTERLYEDLVAAMDRAASKMDPVLAAFRDQTLFLKHNLNARAIASLEGQLDILEGDIAVLIDDMERSIAEANLFIERLNAS